MAMHTPHPPALIIHPPHNNVSAKDLAVQMRCKLCVELVLIASRLPVHLTLLKELVRALLKMLRQQRTQKEEGSIMKLG